MRSKRLSEARKQRALFMSKKTRLNPFVKAPRTALEVTTESSHNILLHLLLASNVADRPETEPLVEMKRR